MRITGMKSLLFATSAIAGITVLLSAAAAPPRQVPQATTASTAVSSTSAPPLTSPVSLTLDPAQSKVHFIVPTTLHTVHGTFDVTRGSLNFDPGSGTATGQIVVNAKSGQSGNNSRDSRMHKEILETSRFPEAVFRPTQIEGVVSSAGACEIKVHGAFSVHGSDHDVIALVHAELAGQTWRGTATFDVPYVQWGIKDPSNFLLKVNHVVSVEIEMAGSFQPSR